MADQTIKISITGAAEFQAALKAYPQRSQEYMQQAAHEALTKYVLDEPGLRQYPPATAANAPPFPYYQRGAGMVYKTKGIVYSSEMYGKAWFIQPQGYGAVIGNDASYAKYLTDDTLQAKAMSAKGWKKLYRVILAKMPQITGVFNSAVNVLLREVGLK